MPVTYLPFVQQCMTRYIMSSYFALGILGNICNCLVFSKASNRQTPCSVYLFALSSFALLYLLWSIIPLLYTLDHPDPQLQSLIYCKTRLYGSHVLGQCVRSVTIFACADRYFMTRTNVRLRSWSSVTVAYRAIPIASISWMILGLHLPVRMDIRSSVCGMFDFYRIFYPCYQFILVGFLPPVLMCVFGYLTVRSLRQRHGANPVHVKQKDRDLMRMLIAEILINVITSIPFSANLIYSASTSAIANKSAERREIEAFVNYLSQFLIHLLSAAPFYLFILSSKSFRHEFAQLCVKYWSRYVLRRVCIARHQRPKLITTTVSLTLDRRSNITDFGT